MRNVVDDQRKAVEHKHTYIRTYMYFLMGM